MIDFVQAGEQRHERDAFDGERGGDDHGEHAADLVEFRGAELVGGEQPLRGFHVMVGGQGDQRCERHDAQAAHLHRHQQHHLAERGPVRGRVHDGDAACRQCGHGGEERGGEAGRLLFV